MLYRIKAKITWPQKLILFVHLNLAVILLSTVHIYAIARGYHTNDQGLQTGMVAALSTNSGTDPAVERASEENGDRVVGVVTTIDNSLVTVGSSSSKVLVENEGQVDGYVSDISGEVLKGDLLVLSPLKGVLMKGLSNSTANVIAIAADNPGFSTSYPYTVEGKTLNANIAKVKLNLNHLGSVSNGAIVTESPLARVGRSIVGKEVGEIRVLIAMIIFIIVLIAEGTILYGAISSAVTALGRNPLAKKIIRAELIRVIVVALMVLIVGLGAVYGILWV